MVVLKYDGAVTTREVGTDGAINARFAAGDTGDTVKLAGADAAVIGVFDGGKVNNHDGTAADPYLDGDKVAVRHRGIVVMEAGGDGITVGALVKSDANGKPVVYTVGADTEDMIAGRAMTAGDTGDDIEVMLG